MSQSSAIAATAYGELVSPEETQDMKTQDTGPSILHIKGVISGTALVVQW